MNSDVPSVDRDSAQQIENNKPTDDGLTVSPSELDGKVSMTVSADAAGSLMSILIWEKISLCKKWTVKHGKIYHCH